MPLPVHIYGVVDRILLLVILSAIGALGLFAAAKGEVFQALFITIVGNTGADGRGAIELVFEEALVSIWTVAADVGVAGDEAGPDGGERQEDADDGRALGSELGDILVELEADEDSCGC